MFDSDDNSGRVKGSIKDRIISFLYRKRFKIKLYKNKLIKKATIVRLIYKKRAIKNYRDLKNLGKKVIEVDTKKEKFDFDKYDYYIIEPIKKKGIDIKEIKNINEKKQIINTTIKIITDTKKDIKKIAVNLNYPKEHQENLDKETSNIINNINRLKVELPKLDNNINITKLNDFKVPSTKDEVKKADTDVNPK